MNELKIKEQERKYISFRKSTGINCLSIKNIQRATNSRNKFKISIAPGPHIKNIGKPSAKLHYHAKLLEMGYSHNGLLHVQHLSSQLFCLHVLKAHFLARFYLRFLVCELLKFYRKLEKS